MSSRESEPELPWYLQPMRVHGGIQVLLGLFLLGLGLHAHGVAKLQVDLSLSSVSLSNLQALFGEVSGSPILALRIGGPLVVMVVAFIAGLTHLVAGIGRMTQLEQADRNPQRLGDVDQVVDSVINARIPQGIDQHDSFMHFVRSNFTDRVDFVPKSYTTLFRDYLWYLITVVVILVGLILLKDQELALGNYEKVGKLYFALPFVGTLIGILLAVVVLRLVFAALLLPKVPQASVAVDRQEFSAAGHPRTVLEELRSALARVGGGRLGDVLVENDMVLEQDPVSDVGRAKASLVVEGRPSLSAEFSKRTYLLGCAHSIVGAFLIFGGLFFMLKLSAVAGDQSGFNVGPPVLVICVGMLAFSNGGQFFENAVTLLRRCVYQSVIYCIELKGTVYRSEVGAGMGSNDTFRSSSVAVRSEIFVDYAVASCVSEGSGGERRLLELNVNKDVREKLAMLKSTVAGNESRGASVLGMSVEGSPQVGEIAWANKVNFEARQAAIANSAATAQPAVQEPAGASGPFIKQAEGAPSQPCYPSQPLPGLAAMQGVHQPFRAAPHPLSDTSTASPEAVPIQVVGMEDIPFFAREVTSAQAPPAPNLTPFHEERAQHTPPVVLSGNGVAQLPSADPANALRLPAAPPELPAGQPQFPGLASSMPNSILTRPRAQGPTSMTAGGITASAAFAFASTRHAPSHDAVKIISASPQAQHVAETKDCPDCAETIKQAALLCRFCGHRFD